MEFFSGLLPLLFKLLFHPFNLVLAILIVVCALKNKAYKATSYYQVTQLPYLTMRRDSGRYGEYLLYSKLQDFEKAGAKFLFNVYIPKKNGGTTEIDVLMICAQGIFVFESKNFSGWIFGKENNKNWCQVLPTGRRRSHKERFYNPIWQNQGHINHLKTLVGAHVPFHSVVVFSDKCSFQDVTIHENSASVIHLFEVNRVVNALCRARQAPLLSMEEVVTLYERLLPCTQVDEYMRAQHNEDVRNSRG